MPKGEAALCGFLVSRTNVERSTKANAEQAGRAGRVILEVSDIEAAYNDAKQRNTKGLTPPARIAAKVGASPCLTLMARWYLSYNLRRGRSNKASVV
jgi:hypothetical protein